MYNSGEITVRVFVLKVLKPKRLRCYSTLRIVCLYEAQTTFIVLYGTLRSKQISIKRKATRNIWNPFEEQ